MNALRLALVGILALTAWKIQARSVTAAEESDQQNDTLGGWLADEAVVIKEWGSDIMNQISGWSPDKIPAAYGPAIYAAEVAHGIPEWMLARLLWQESRYRQDIISGAKRSAVGALGIAQFMPATAAEMGINPLDPFQAIDAAGRYLARLYKSLGAWDKALAAYNWGIGNVQRKGLAAAPRETRNYYNEILADIGMSSTYA